MLGQSVPVQLQVRSRRPTGAFDVHTVSNRTTSASIAFSVANKNVAENVPRLILFAMLASVSYSPCRASRSASPSVQHRHALTRNGNGRTSGLLGTLDLLPAEGTS